MRDRLRWASLPRRKYAEDATLTLDYGLEIVFEVDRMRDGQWKYSVMLKVDYEDTYIYRGINAKSPYYDADAAKRGAWKAYIDWASGEWYRQETTHALVAHGG